MYEYIGIIVFRLLKHSDELDISLKTSTLLGGTTLLWGGGARPPVPPPPLVTALSLGGIWSEPTTSGFSRPAS